MVAVAAARGEGGTELVLDDRLVLRSPPLTVNQVLNPGVSALSFRRSANHRAHPETMYAFREVHYFAEGRNAVEIKFDLHPGAFNWHGKKPPAFT